MGDECRSNGFRATDLSSVPHRVPEVCDPLITAINITEVCLAGISICRCLPMAFAQFTYRESLRDIEACLGSMGGKLYHMGFRSRIARSTLADGNQTHDWCVLPISRSTWSALPDHFMSRIPWTGIWTAASTRSIRPPLTSVSPCFRGRSFGSTTDSQSHAFEKTTIYRPPRHRTPKKNHSISATS
jgi:Domain of unknown function (DUF4372)